MFAHRILPFLAALVIGAVLPLGPVLAEKLPPAVIAIIDSQKILRDAVAAKDVRSQLRTIRATFQKELTGEEEKLREEEQQLLRQRSILSTEAFDAKREEFERKVTAVQRGMQDRNRALQSILADANKKIVRAVYDIVAGMVESRGFNIVLDRAQTVFLVEGVDISADVITELDKKLPTIPIKVPVQE